MLNTEPYRACSIIDKVTHMKHVGMCRIVILPDTGYPVTIECRIPDIQFMLNVGYPTINDKYKVNK